MEQLTLLISMWQQMPSTNNHLKTYTILGGQNQCYWRMSSYALFMTRCKNYTSKVASVQQNDI